MTGIRANNHRIICPNAWGITPTTEPTQLIIDLGYQSSKEGIRPTRGDSSHMVCDITIVLSKRAIKGIFEALKDIEKQNPEVFADVE